MTNPKVIPTDQLNSLVKMYDPSKNMSVNFLTKFEMASVLGVREEQIAQGSPSVLTNEEMVEMTSSRMVAERELQLKKLPFMILRTMPSGKQELWRLHDLHVVV